MLLLPLLPGLAQGIFSGITGAQNTNSQINAANRLAIQQYKQLMAERLARYQGEINQYNTQKLQYEQGLRSSQEAYYQGIGQNQEYLNDIRSNLGIQSNNVLTELLGGQGKIAASDLAAGNSTTRLSNMAASQAGQQMALNQESLANAYKKVRSSNDQLTIQRRRAEMNSWLPLTFRPDPGFAPAKPYLQGTQNVFAAGLMGGLQGAVGGAADILAKEGFKGLGIGKY
jgi:hypothetical protein